MRIVHSLRSILYRSQFINSHSNCISNMTSPTRNASTALPTSTPHSAPPQRARSPSAFDRSANFDNPQNRTQRNTTERGRGQSGRSDGAWTRDVMQEHVKGSRNEGSNSQRNRESSRERVATIEAGRIRPIQHNTNQSPRSNSPSSSTHPAQNRNNTRPHSPTKSQAPSIVQTISTVSVTRVKLKIDNSPSSTPLPTASTSTASSTATSVVGTATPTTKKPRNRKKKQATQLMDAAERAERKTVDDETTSSVGEVDDIELFKPMLESRRASDVTVDNLNEEIMRLYDVSLPLFTVSYRR